MPKAPISRTASANRNRRSERMSVMEGRTTSALLYLDGVHVSFDGFHAINNLSLTLEPGEMRAIIGPNGAGKTTMMDIITGKTKPDEGAVLFDGVTDLTRLDETRIAELGIGRKFQKPTVFETHKTAELLKEINRDHTVMVVEHDMTFVRELGVKVTCLHEGTVLAEGTIDQVSSNERVIEVYLGR